MCGHDSERFVQGLLGRDEHRELNGRRGGGGVFAAA